MQNVLTLRVNFAGRLQGCVASQFKPNFNDKQFHCFAAEEILAGSGKPTAIESTEVITIEFYRARTYIVDQEGMTLKEDEAVSALAWLSHR